MCSSTYQTGDKLAHDRFQDAISHTLQLPASDVMQDIQRDNYGSSGASILTQSRNHTDTTSSTSRSVDIAAAVAAVSPAPAKPSAASSRKRPPSSRTISRHQALAASTTTASAIDNFWTEQMSAIRNTPVMPNYHALPHARIKTLMKTDDAIKRHQISAEVPAVFEKACEIMIKELTLCASLEVELGRRRTLQRGDVITAVSRDDKWDFLVDVVPRDEKVRAEAKRRANASDTAAAVDMGLQAEAQALSKHIQPQDHRKLGSVQRLISESVSFDSPVTAPAVYPDLSSLIGLIPTYRATGLADISEKSLWNGAFQGGT